MAFPTPLEQAMASILQSKHQRMLKMPRRKQDKWKAIHGPTVNIQAVLWRRHELHNVFVRWCGSTSSYVHRLFINWHIQGGWLFPWLFIVTFSQSNFCCSHWTAN